MEYIIHYYSQYSSSKSCCMHLGFFVILFPLYYTYMFLNFLCRNNSYFNAKINATSMIQDLGFGTSFTSLSAHELQLARIKQELSSSSSDISNYPKFTAMLNSPSSSSSIELDSHLLYPSSSSCSYNIQNDQQRDLLKTFSSGCQINGLHQLPATRGTFSQIFPTINISNFNQSASNSAVSSSSSLDMNLEVLDLFNSVRFSGSLSSQPSQDYLGLLKSSLPYSLDNMQQQSRHRPSNSSPTHVSLYILLPLLLEYLLPLKQL